MSQYTDEALTYVAASTGEYSPTTRALAVELLQQRAENTRLKAELAKANKLEEGLLVTGEKLAEQAE